MPSKKNKDFLSHIISGHADLIRDDRYKTIILHVLTLCYIVITLVTLVFNLSSPLLRWINTPVIILLLIINYLWFKRKRKVQVYALFFLSIGILNLIYSLVVLRDTSLSPLPWCLIIPTLSIILLELKWGSYVSLGFFLFLSGYLIFNASIYESESIDVYFILSYLFTYVFSWVISSFFVYFIHKTINQLRRSNTIISEANDSRENFLADLSHQIRTPLNDIMAFNEMIDTLDIPEKNRELFEMVRASSQNLIHAVGSFNRFGKFSSPKKKVNLIPFDIVHHLSQLEESVNRQNKDKMVFKIQTKGYLPNQVNGDPVILNQIILSLVEGILRNTTPQKTLEIGINSRFEEQQDHLVFSGVVTSAPPPPYDPDRFIQLKEIAESGISAITSNEELPYLNLLLAMDLCNHIGGKLELVKTTGEPVKIRFELPLTEVKSSVHAPSVINEEVTPVVKTSLSESNVLLVEDNPINQKIVMASLKPHVKNIDLAEDGKQALDYYGKNRYDFILMDIQIPIMDGMLVTRKIREIEDSTHTHTAIIAITANAMPGDRETCLSAGMDEYLSKPFMINDLIEKMKILLQ